LRETREPASRLAAIRAFLQTEAGGGVVLAAAALLAILCANSALDGLYGAFRDLPVELRIGQLEIAKPLLLWVNDGLMAIFFFLVGLEIKRECLEGELLSVAQASLPAVAALGGILVPAAIYVAINAGNAEDLQGWAIPAATDIAFALGVLALLGERVPLSLRVLVMAIAVFDDLGAIVIIALFYTEDLAGGALAFSLIAFGLLVALNRAGVMRTAPYVVIGVVMWVAVLKSGVHATLAGVAVALTIPLRRTDAQGRSPLRQLEHGLHPWVAFCILPLFAFANAGVSFAGVGIESFLVPVQLGIAAGLFLGKQIGIFGCLLLMIRTGLARMPAGASWGQLYGVSLLCGIGFTMSLFIGGLAWEHADFDDPVRLGVITGSLLAALGGFLVLWACLPARAGERTQVAAADHG
jgi:NhaA family Na+:H+ antiporter